MEEQLSLRWAPRLGGSWRMDKFVVAGRGRPALHLSTVYNP